MILVFAYSGDVLISRLDIYARPILMHLWIDLPLDSRSIPGGCCALLVTVYLLCTALLKQLQQG